ncbi:MAG: Monosaccharide ABC-type transport system, rane component of superfamily, partial [Mycobacterium sp.]|nr:Monosaccharide ABC-type transport system, rane component of superfamily [Mycobacterium sp.]
MSITVDPNAGPTAPPVRARGRVLPSPVTPAEIVLIVVLVALWAALGFATPAFLSSGSIIPLLVEVAPVALIGIGMTFVIITGGIDVSVGGAIMVCSVVTAKLMRDQGLPLILCV